MKTLKRNLTIGVVATTLAAASLSCKTPEGFKLADTERVNDQGPSEVVFLENGLVKYKLCDQTTMIELAEGNPKFPKDSSGRAMPTGKHCRDTVDGYKSYDEIPLVFYKSIFDESNVDINRHIYSLRSAQFHLKTELKTLKSAEAELQAAKRRTRGKNAAELEESARQIRLAEAYRDTVAIRVDRLKRDIKNSKAKLEIRRFVFDSLEKGTLQSVHSRSRIGEAIISPFRYLRGRKITGNAIAEIQKTQTKLLPNRLTHYEAAKACAAQKMQMANAKQLGAYLLVTKAKAVGKEEVWYRKTINDWPSKNSSKLTTTFGFSKKLANSFLAYQLGEIHSINARSHRTSASLIFANSSSLQRRTLCVADAASNYVAELEKRNYRFCHVAIMHKTIYKYQDNRTIYRQVQGFALNSKLTRKQLWDQVWNKAAATRYKYSNMIVPYKILHPEGAYCGQILDKNLSVPYGGASD